MEHRTRSLFQNGTLTRPLFHLQVGQRNMCEIRAGAMRFGLLQISGRILYSLTKVSLESCGTKRLERQEHG
jgi:hypothetical protein